MIAFDQVVTFARKLFFFERTVTHSMCAVLRHIIIYANCLFNIIFSRYCRPSFSHSMWTVQEAETYFAFSVVDDNRRGIDRRPVVGIRRAKKIRNVARIFSLITLWTERSRLTCKSVRVTRVQNYCHFRASWLVGFLKTIRTFMNSIFHVLDGAQTRISNDSKATLYRISIQFSLMPKIPNK